MTATHYSTEQLCRAARVERHTISRHVKAGWLQPEIIPGAKGNRFRADRARRWLRQRYPEIPVTKLDEPLPQPTRK